jgi:prepilin-type N-terminal cleavage/methylation domain-containing protein
MSTQQGLSLIEILVSLCIFSLLLFGVNSAQFAALRAAKQSYWLALAQAQLMTLNERLQVTPPNQFQEVIQAWQSNTALLMPHGRGEISGYPPDVLATIFWGDTNKNCLNHPSPNDGCLQMEIHQ